jgi:hypothetical protein
LNDPGQLAGSENYVRRREVEEDETDARIIQRKITGREECGSGECVVRGRGDRPGKKTCAGGWRRVMG